MNPLADRNASQVVFVSQRGNICEVKIEDDFGAVKAERTDEVGVHNAIVPIDHEVWIDPIIVSLLPLANHGRRSIALVVYDRGPLQTETGAGFDSVLAVIEHAIEPPMEVGDVVTAVKIVVDENFPITFECVMPSLYPMEILKP